MSPGTEHVQTIRALVAQHARLVVSPDEIAPHTNLYEVGLSSMTAVHLMVALEAHYDVEFPDDLLGRKTFESIQAIYDAVMSLRT